MGRIFEILPADVAMPPILDAIHYFSFIMLLLIILLPLAAIITIIVVAVRRSKKKKTKIEEVADNVTDTSSWDK